MLNWINVAGLRRMAKRMPGLKNTFNTVFFVPSLERIASDSDSAERRSSLACKAILILMQFRLHQLFQFMPAMVQPVMNYTVESLLGVEEP